MTGFEVLRWLKSHPVPSVTVVVLSGSPLQQDIEASLALGANGYWNKTASLDKLRLITTEIEGLLDGRSSFYRNAQISAQQNESAA